MKKRVGTLVFSFAAAFGALSSVASDADACGGCFHPADDPEVTVVTGHRMAFAISPTQTVLWDQVEYSGSPTEFAWVLPIKPGARLELASASWFEALDAATSTRVVAPQLNCVQFANGPSYPTGCDSGCCGSTECSGVYYSEGTSGDSAGPSGSGGEPPVTVVKRETVGPYDFLILHTNTPGVLTDWLIMNKFAIDPTVEPIIDQYTSEGFDFIAMRLQPDKGVQDMKPVRVVSPGASPTLPLRMVSAGTGANTAVTLFVLGEGRWEAENFPNTKISASNLTWDFATSKSDYAEARAAELAKDNGRTWLTSYATQGALLSQTSNSLGILNSYSVDGSFGNQSLTIADLIVATGVSNGETPEADCSKKFAQYTKSNDLVVNPCEASAGGGGGGSGGASGSGGGGGSGGAGQDCAPIEAGQIDARDFACAAPSDLPDEPFDDISVALTGMHPSSVWITRLEANLSRKALETDLSLAAASSQSLLDNWLQAGIKKNVPCQEVEGFVPPMKPQSPPFDPKRRELTSILAVLMGLGLALLRRARRLPAPALAR